MQHQAFFTQLRGIAAALRAGQCDARALSDAVTEAAPLIAALPPAYERVMSDIVTRLESSALFGGESCSFSHTDLYDALDAWIAKAEAKIVA